MSPCPALSCSACSQVATGCQHGTRTRAAPAESGRVPPARQVKQQPRLRAASAAPHLLELLESSGCGWAPGWKAAHSDTSSQGPSEQVNHWAWGKILQRIKACLDDKKQRSCENSCPRVPGRDSGQEHWHFLGHKAILVLL